MSVDRSRAIFQGPYGKTVTQLKRIAIEHWADWRPREVKQLVKEGRLHEVALKAAERAFQEIEELRRAGYQNHEAEEVVMPRYIILKPEKQVKGELERIASLEGPPDRRAPRQLSLPLTMSLPKK
jgi:hypothetical protein